MIHRCLATPAGRLREHPGFARALEQAPDSPELVYLWEDRSVTDLPLVGAEPLFTAEDEAWRTLCARLLERA